VYTALAYLLVANTPRPVILVAIRKVVIALTCCSHRH
jgi:hypothetical protein